MENQNLYGLSDDEINQIEEELEVLDESLGTSEEFIDAAFPNLDSKTKVKIAMFSGAYYEAFLENYEED